MIKPEISKDDIKSIYITIGKNVKNARKKKGMTQLQLSMSIGHKAVGTVSMCELCLNGKHFNIEHLIKIANALDCSVVDFFKDIKVK
ncbi:MAG: XRE family transcriptional regulator [Epsilonproteobacteria bacterium]|nr:MAG: XRE family transcriptional regulator [Campylobacterota bacterium]